MTEQAKYFLEEHENIEYTDVLHALKNDEGFCILNQLSDEDRSELIDHLEGN